MEEAKLINPYCAICGDTRGGPMGHETSECTYEPDNKPTGILAYVKNARVG